MVFDLDGVLSNAEGRQHFLEGPQRDWEAFFDACGDDPLIDDVARLLDLLDDKLAVILLTARPIKVQPQTLAWLDRYELRWDLLLMRPAGRRVSSPDFKAEAIEELRHYGFDLRLGFEDDLRNIDRFHAAGIPCIYIHSGYYE